MIQDLIAKFLFLERKDKFTLIVSIAAAVISLISLLTGFFQKRSDAQQTIRSSLTDVIKYLDYLLNEENELETKSSKFSEANRLNRRPYLNGRKRFLARSAIALMEQLPKKMITDFEYNSVADVFRDIDEYEQANIYYKKGINRATVPYYK